MTLHQSQNKWCGKIFQQAEAFGVKGQQVLDVITLTRSAIKEELQAEIVSGRYNSVGQFLLNQSVQHGKNLLFDKIIQKVAIRLILRLGFPGGLAVSIATLIVPILIKGVTKKILKNTSVSEWLLQFTNRHQITDLLKFKNYLKKDSGAEAA